MPRPSAPALLLSFALFVSPAGGAAGEHFRRGDATGDGRVDIGDPVATLFGLFAGGTLGCRDAADSNDDGLVDLSDAVATLRHLFLGGPPPPPPGAGRCAGPDPTPDGLGCAAGETPALDPPSAAFWPEPAPAPAVRQRRGAPLPAAGGAFRVGEGVSFALVVEAASNPLTQAELALGQAGDPRAGNPDALEVTCDRPLGDPARGGVPAGENLAPLFLSQIDHWSDPVFLIQRAAWRIDGRSEQAPAPGRYRFEVRVIDAACAASPPAGFELEVLPSREPEVHLSLEDDSGGLTAGVPRPASAATGGLTLGAGEAAHLVVLGLPNGRAAAGDPAHEIDPESLHLEASRPIVDGAGAYEDLRSRFAFDGPAPGGGLRWRLRLDPAASGLPLKGNTFLAARLSTRGGAHTGLGSGTLEVEVSYALDIQPLWNRECTGCHERPQLEKGLELVGPPPARTHRNLVHVYAAEPAIDSQAPLHIRAHRPEASYLIHKLEGTHLGPPVLGSGDRMPRGGPPFLPDAELRLIRDWVLQGARAP